MEPPTKLQKLEISNEIDELLSSTQNSEKVHSVKKKPLSQKFKTEVTERVCRIEKLLEILLKSNSNCPIQREEAQVHDPLIQESEEIIEIIIDIEKMFPIQSIDKLIEINDEIYVNEPLKPSLELHLKKLKEEQIKIGLSAIIDSKIARFVSWTNSSNRVCLSSMPLFAEVLKGTLIGRFISRHYLTDFVFRSLVL